MTTVVVSDRRTTQVQLPVGDSFVLTVDGSISENVAAGVVGFGGNSLTIDGDILARGSTGVLLGTGNSNVSISGTGTVIGNTGVNANGRVTIQNAGEIIGLTLDGILLLGDQSVVSNSGFIFGGRYGIGAGTGSHDITNTGFIQGVNNGILITSTNNVVRNFGTITAHVGIELSGGSGAADTIINWGTIIGQGGEGIFIGNTSNEAVINRGTIVGSVTTGVGNDLFDNSFGGIVTGPVIMFTGNDTVIAGQGAENIDGGSGIDTISYINHPRGVLINLTNQATSDGIVTDTLASFENAVGSVFNDTIYGDDSAVGNVLDGGPGGSDQIFGGGGPDTVSYASAVRAVLINLTGQVTADGVDTDTLSSIENAVGSRFNDTIYGNNLDNVLDGGVEGSDQIFGGFGIDTVSYATSPRAVLINLADQVTADGINNDPLSSIENAIGSAFSDTIVSGAGTNVLEGGGGYDTFLFRRGQANGDTVVDFAGNGAAPGDVLQFVGYGPSATFVPIDATHWQVSSGPGTPGEIITFQNGAVIDMSDVLFV
jgi:hypothetical protein